MLTHHANSPPLLFSSDHTPLGAVPLLYGAGRKLLTRARLWPDTLRFGSKPVTQTHPLLAPLDTLIEQIATTPQKATELTAIFLKQNKVNISPKLFRSFHLVQQYYRGKLRKDGSAEANHSYRIMASLIRQGKSEHYWRVALLHDIPEQYGGWQSLVIIALKVDPKTAWQTLMCSDELNNWRVPDWETRKKVGLKRFVMIKDKNLFDLKLTEKIDSATSLVEAVKRQSNPREFLDSLDFEYRVIGLGAVLVSYIDIAKLRAPKSDLIPPLEKAVDDLMHLVDRDVESVCSSELYKSLRTYIKTLSPKTFS